MCLQLLHGWVSLHVRFLKSWHSPTGEDSDSLPFMVSLVTTWHFGGKKKKKSNSRALIWGKGLAAVKTGKSMVSTEKRVRYTSTQQFLGDKRPAVEKRAERLAIYWKLYAAGCVSGSRCEQIVYVAVFCRFCGLLVIVWSTVSLCHTHTERETLGIPLISSG